MEEQQNAGESLNPMESSADSQIAVALLTGVATGPMLMVWQRSSWPKG